MEKESPPFTPKETLLPKTVVFGKGRCYGEEKLFDSLWDAVDVVPYKPEKRKD